MYDTEIEKAMLFYIIFDNEQYELTEKDFVDERNKKIIKTINELKIQKQEVSLLALNEKMKDYAMLEYVAHLGDYIQTSTPQMVYKRLKEYTKKRQIFNLAQKIQMEIGMENERKIENIEADVYIEKMISELQKIEFQTEHEENFTMQVIDTMTFIEQSINKKEDYSLYTGFFDLDDLTDGLHNGELTVVGARPAVGKTTFALQIAENISKKGKKVAFVSLEMSGTQMIQKILSMRTHVNSRKIRNGDLSNEDSEKIFNEGVKLANMKFNLLTKLHTIQQIEITARRMKNQNNIDLLIIDYLQLVRNAGNFKSREQEVADISRTLKLLSLELDIPIIALCQLNRNATKTEPTLADIRESGAIEQDADNVIFLYQKNADNNIVTVDLQKQRAGNTGSLELKFNKHTSEFINLAR